MTNRGFRRTGGLVCASLLAVGLLFGGVSSAQAAPRESADATIVDSTGRAGRTAALIFDDGPDPRNTARMLDVLGEHQVKAVFCLWGEHVRQHPELVRRIVGEGHTLCNHTMRHENMSAWSRAEIRQNLRATNAAIHAAAPDAEVRYFRAPNGAWGETPRVAAELGMQPLGWSLSVGDWNRPGTDVLVRRLREGLAPGSVVLLHDGGGDRGQTVDAVSRFVPWARGEGWNFTLPA